MNSMIKILFLASGGGGNFKFFCHAKKRNIISDCEYYLIADRECGASKYAHENNITHKVIHYTRDNPSQLQEQLKLIKPDITFTNWHKIIDTDTVKTFRGTLINLHYSLLPAFGGVIGIKPIEMAKAQGCKYVGVSSHFVDEGVDTGRIICQSIVKVDDNFDVPNVMDIIFKKGCKVLLNSILLNNHIHLIKQNTDDDFSFSPSLQFKQNLFSNTFWNEVKHL